jgi:hypothetical protein
MVQRFGASCSVLRPHRQGSEVSGSGSALLRATEAASLIEKETNVVS